jgi:predicted unusual protein kinase regulating ubiquinone biosynthesis (AarF/ABC1/UbiB family)
LPELLFNCVLSMHHEPKWKNWPVLLLGIILVILLLVLANILRRYRITSTYITDIAGAISAVVISIATYDEWERRQERKRYRPPEQQGLKRIKNEIAQLIFQYEFMLNGRFNTDERTMELVDGAKNSAGRSNRQIKAAKQLAESKLETEDQPLSLSIELLKQPKIDKLSYLEAEQLLAQIEITVRRIDSSIATYGYSFTPEIHKASLALREKLEQTATGKRALLSIGLTAASSKASSKLSLAEQDSLLEITNELIRIAKQADKLQAI